MAKKRKKLDLPVEELWTPLQKGILGAFVSFVPFFFIVLLPLATRYYIQSSLKIEPSILYSAPQQIFLVKTGEIPPLMRFRIGKFEFRVPENQSPTFVTRNSVIFREKPRSLSRTCSFGIFPKGKRIDLSNTGFIEWLVPEDMLSFFESTLPATWNPARLLCKAHFLTSQGIGSQIFYSDWDENHKGFIFPLSGNTGYVGRIFSLNGPECSEFTYFDEIDAITLRKWVDIAQYIRLLTPEAEKTPISRETIAETMESANGNFQAQARAIEISLNNFFAIGSSSWLIPTATVLKKRGFFKEVIFLFRTYAPSEKKNKLISQIWRALLDTTVKEVLSLQIDRHLNLNSLVITCKNLGDFPLTKVKLEIKFILKDDEKVFQKEICKDSMLHPGNEKTVEIDFPSVVSVNSAQKIEWTVTDVGITE